MRQLNLRTPLGILSENGHSSLGTWFGALSEFGSELNDLAKQPTNIVRHLILILPRREFASLAIIYGYIHRELSSYSAQENQGFLAVEQLKKGMFISGFRVSINPKFQARNEFLAEVEDLSFINDTISPRVGLKVQGRLDYWHRNSLIELREVSVLNGAERRLGFYRERVSDPQQPWQWLIGESAQDLRNFQEPMINLRANKNRIEEEWNCELMWTHEENTYKARIERLMCPLKKGIPGPFFTDVNFIETQSIDLKTTGNFKIQILDSIHAIKNNIEYPASKLVLSILARSEFRSKSVVPALENLYANSHPVNFISKSIENVFGSELLVFGRST